ncbi:MAG: hypothetical protein RIQ52_1820 [Pseudomonadota bacterium]|jgi:methionine-rich copper-binding protein CopC
MKQSSACKRLSLTALLVLPSLLAGNAWAEGRLIGGAPRDNEITAKFDGTLKLWFTGNIGERSPSLVILDKSGQRVDRQDASITIGERSELKASTASPLPPGSYVAHYRVITEDGLVISGIYRFSVKVNETQGGAP